MTWLEKRLKERIEKGGLKLAYDPYDRADREEWSPCLTTNCGQWGKCSTIVMFEYEKRNLNPRFMGGERMEAIANHSFTGGVIPNSVRGNGGEGEQLRMDNGIKLAGSVNRYGFAQADAVYSVKGLSPTILAHNQGQTGHAIQIIYEERVQNQTEAAPKVRDDREGV